MNLLRALAQALAQALGRHAESVLAIVRPEQGRAIAAEIAHIDRPVAALVFALGGVLAAWRGRFSAPAAGIVLARLMIALAAGMMGYVHLQITGSNLGRKLALMAGDDAGMTPYLARMIDQQSLAYFLWHFGVLGGMGALHVAAALAMAVGATRAVYRIALAIAALSIALPVLGAGGLTLPLIYLALIGLMALAAWILARWWRRDEQRMAAR
jgi:hypothetical protein